MNSWYVLVAARAGHRCEYCRAPESIFNIPFEVDHIHPRSLGGGDDDRNLALACRSCNLAKSDHCNATVPESGRIFHPRQDRWDDHFAVSPQMTIVGKTPVGRTTVELLRMNRLRALAARHSWKAIGLYP